MSQHDYIIDNDLTPAFRADLNLVLAAIVTQNSDVTEPAVKYANMIWYDTSTDTLKMRNEANSGWIILGTVDQTTDTFNPNFYPATQAEAEAGTDNVKGMTALRVAQAAAIQILAERSAAATIANKRITARVSSTTSTASITPDISAYGEYCVTAQAVGLTINAPNGTPVDGDKLIFRILDNGASQTLTWNATFTGIGFTLPSVTTVSKIIYVESVYNAANTRWDVTYVANESVMNGAPPVWVSAGSYILGALVYSPIDFLTYRAKIAHSGITTDPSLDTTRWVSQTSSAAVSSTPGFITQNTGGNAPPGSFIASGSVSLI